MSWVFVFAAMAAADVFWACWSAAVTARRPALAATHGAAIVVCGAFPIVEYVSNHWLLVPAVAGAWFGTYVSVKWTQLTASDTER
ncbi:MAG TPA: hypothetical protein VII58_00395 [Acidobacteriaceae bacterium]